MVRLSGTVRVRAPAKVNLSLRIVGRRPDGYHLLESLMVPVSFYDEITIALGSSGRGVQCRVHGVSDMPGGKENLAARAADLVLKELGCRLDVMIELDKHIPVAAGLGGGSSDAAAVLRVLPRMLGRRIGRRRLLEMALSLGADVPFFIAGTPAFAAGIGERLVPLTEFPRLPLVIVVPAARVETRWAFAHALSGLTSKKPRNSRAMRSRLAPASIVAELHNDFEVGVGAAVEDVHRLLSELRRLGALGTVMSGSGSAVVGVFETLAEAREAAGRFSRPDVARAVRVLRRPPSPVWL